VCVCTGGENSYRDAAYVSIFIRLKFTIWLGPPLMHGQG